MRPNTDRITRAEWRAVVIPAAIGAVLTMGLVFAVATAAHAHDWKRPDLDDWYGGLHRPHVSPTSPYGGSSCCSKTDCHTTESELRQGDWWARLGTPKANGDWDLRDWVRVPADVVIQQHDNPAGEGVICHSTGAWTNGPPGQQKYNAAGITIWCFVPPTES